MDLVEELLKLSSKLRALSVKLRLLKVGTLKLTLELSSMDLNSSGERIKSSRLVSSNLLLCLSVDGGDSLTPTTNKLLLSATL